MLQLLEYDQHASSDGFLDEPFEVDVDNVKAEHRDGILALHLFRAEQDKPRSIAIG